MFVNVIYVVTQRFLDIDHLQQLPILLDPWQSISLDFIIDLLLSNSFDVILTVVDNFTKMEHFLRCMMTYTSQEMANLVMREVFKHHVFPYDMISDREPQFVSKCLVNSVQATILKLVVKVNEQTKHLNNIFDASITINKTLGLIFYTWLSLRVSTLPTLLQDTPHFLQRKDITLVSSCLNIYKS
jgi:hypothetical protein